MTKAQVVIELTLLRKKVFSADVDLNIRKSGGVERAGHGAEGAKPAKSIFQYSQRTASYTQRNTSNNKRTSILYTYSICFLCIPFVYSFMYPSKLVVDNTKTRTHCVVAVVVVFVLAWIIPSRFPSLRSAFRQKSFLVPYFHFGGAQTSKQY